jgi:hypothetical protein
VKRPSMVALLATLGAAALGWFLTPPEELAKPLVQLRRDTWALPDLPRKPELTAAGLASVSSPIFDAEPKIDAKQVPLVDDRWRLAGILRRGTERTALVIFKAPGKEALRLRVGDMLPGGYKITGIEDSEICVLIGKKTFRLGVAYRD